MIDVTLMTAVIMLTLTPMTCVTARFVVGSNRVLFMCRDGSKAWDIKDFLVQQDNCDSVEIEGQTFLGKGGKGVSLLLTEREGGVGG